MNRIDRISIDNAARFLNHIYPTVNWVWFLSKNLHGLTEGYPTIPFDNSLEGVIYNLDDLKSFALLYGGGNLSEDDISRHAKNFQHQLDLEMAVATPSRILPSGDFMSPSATPDEDYFQLSSGELYAMTERIEQVMDIQNNSISALEALARDIRLISSPGMPSTIDLREMYELADYHADKSDQAHVLLAELDHAIADRCGRNLDRELTELLDALEGTA